MTHSLKATPRPYVKSSEPPYWREGNSTIENSSVLPYCRGLGIEIGPGGNRFSDTVLAVDNNATADCDMVWDYDTLLNYPFKSGTFDFLVSSHVLEDAAPENIQSWFNEWIRLIKVGGYLCLILPDMEGGRYPDVDDKWTEDDELVKRGERIAGDCRGNSAHRITMGKTVLSQLLVGAGIHDGDVKVVQWDTLPKDQMSMDFVVQKLS